MSKDLGSTPSATDKVGGICGARGCFLMAFTDTMFFLIRGSEKGPAKHLSPGANAA